MTESWLKDGQMLDRDIINQEHGTAGPLGLHVRAAQARRPPLGLVQAFLTGRTMQMNHSPNLDPSAAAAPQGSVLGCLLYCLTTQHLNKTAAIRPPHPDDRGQQAGATLSTLARPASPETPMAPQSPQEGFNLLPPSTPPEMNNTPDSPKPVLHDLLKAMEADIEFFKYVDDSTSVQTASSATSIKHFTTRVTYEEVDAGLSRNLLQGIINKARVIGMVVNCGKTQLLCISMDNGCDTFADVTVENNLIRMAKTIKLLGFHFSSNVGMQDQVLEIKKGSGAASGPLSICTRRAPGAGSSSSYIQSLSVRSLSSTLSSTIQ